ncbi:MAG: hypothetical protein WAM39_20385 [Bryobacteraceae bacterium]
MFDLWMKVLRQAAIGAVFMAASVWMTVYVGFLKRDYTEWSMHPHGNDYFTLQAIKRANSINWLLKEHEYVWAVAPYFPPYLWRQPFTWEFVRFNWLLLCWLGLFYGGMWSLGSAFHLADLIGEVSREEKKDRIRRKMRGQGGGDGGAASMEVQAEIRMQAAETGKWWSINGAIVGGSIAGIISGIVLKLLHMS